MIIGEGRSVTVAVVMTGFVLFLLLSVMIVIGFEEYGPRMWMALGGHIVPPPDRALALTRPVPIENLASWLDSDAYPVEAIKANQQGRTVAKLHLDASGSPTACDIAISSRSTALDSTTCAILMRRARFTPARDADGAAIPADYIVPVRWVLPEDQAGFSR